MASLIEGYEYDIFISYRQKDNKYDGWVTEFVDNLKRELEATFKEEISVYFDINPHDGLLETHDVDASLKEKLKCLVFIPIISRTYCDPKSFAWEHEFKAFVEQASYDEFGLKVKLPNGNVVSRILPIHIYDLNTADIKLCETVIGGVLRGIGFIYTEPGVNRPLKPDDDEKINLNKTKYRNQINKVGNAIEEIISGLITGPLEQGKEKIKQKEPLEEVKIMEREDVQERPNKLTKKKLLIGVSILAVLIVVAIFTYPKIFKRNTLERLRSSGERISVAVMPFQNMTNDTTWNVWQDGIQNNLITYLAENEELLLRPSESVKSILESKGVTNYASITLSVASTISKKLDANVVIYGTITKAGSALRLNAQLIDTKTKEILKPFQINGSVKEDSIFQIIYGLSSRLKDFLIITKLKKEVSPDLHHIIPSNSPEAYRYFVNGEDAFSKRDYPTAIKMYLKALAVDSNFFSVTLELPWAYGNQGLYEEAKKWSSKAYEKRDQMPRQANIIANRVYARFYGTLYDDIKYLRQLIEFDDQLPWAYYNLGNDYNQLYEFDKAIIELEKSLELYKKWDSKPMWASNYTALGYAYHKTSQNKKELRLYKIAEKDFPSDPGIIYRQAILALSEGKIKDANEYIEKFISFLSENSESEATIASYLGSIYEDANILDKAEEYYRKALSLESDNSYRLNNLSRLLIEKDRNIDEGLNLGEKALELNPDNYDFLDTKGWGLYKQSKYGEALEILQRSWNLRREKAIYNHLAYLHLEAAKKAIIGQK